MDVLCDMVVVTYNRVDMTTEFVKSLIEHTPLPVRVIFIDNNSSDGTRDYISSLQDTSFVKFQIVLNNENLGFIKGVNQGFKLADSSYVCVANNDLLFSPGWLEEIIEIFKSRPDVGLLNPNSNNRGALPKQDEPIEDFARRLKQQWAGVFVESNFCIGFCMVIRGDVIKKVGGFSEEFMPMFFEDTDYSMRVARAGYRLGVAKGAYVWHHEHASLGQLGAQKEKVFAQSRKRFEQKWGRILWLAWVVENPDELKDNLKEAINLSRGGNHLWFYVRGFNKTIDEKEKI